ncbi:ribokinase [Novibacillus thermophilus]|uniref:Ribokinase n=1 Tax=Novibacillus thermophilus TaxID=1471761 RepID=A0A1U9KCC3_9BACL|nr:ribokinase [Novibacillus thermophilus]AQS57643.1 ribokinase [Novibacillus thermophilus]
MKSKNILVIGSLNIDLVTRVPHLPQPGETIASRKFQKNPGGKGANQAVAAAKLGANVTMIGKVGTDEHGELLINSLRSAGVSTAGIRREGTTGMAFISVSDEGENHIVLVAGDNNAVRRSDISAMRGLIEESDMIVMQLEIPLEVVKHALELAVGLGKNVILNPAPARDLPAEMLRHVYVLIPNETELQILSGMPTSTEQEIVDAARHLNSLGNQRVIVTMGDRGSFLISETLHTHIPAYPVRAVDTTAAGDAYVAAFAVGKTQGMSDVEAAKFASKVAAITVTREGAQPSLPTRDDVQRYPL